MIDGAALIVAGGGSPSRLDCIFAADAILSPSSGLGGVVGHLRAV